MKYNSIPHQLIFAREYRGISQTELAAKISGLSQSNLSKYEKGIGFVSRDILLKVFEFLNFPENFFNKNINNLSDTAHFRKRTTITKN
jgi:transcriptional regulator with XRE-family HTH domain